MSNEIFHLTYTSTISLVGAINPFTFKNVEKIANIRNAQTNIRGFLLFKDGRFFQYIEGNRADLEQLYQTLLKDKRHKNLKRLTEGTRPDYLLERWNMYCFDIAQDPSPTPLNQLFHVFDTYHWVTRDVDRVVADMQGHYENELLKP